MANVLTYYPEVSEMVAGCGSEVYRNLFVKAGTITNGNVRDIKIWDTTIKRKGIIE